MVRARPKDGRTDSAIPVDLFGGVCESFVPNRYGESVHRMHVTLLQIHA